MEVQYLKVVLHPPTPLTRRCSVTTGRPVWTSSNPSSSSSTPSLSCTTPRPRPCSTPSLTAPCWAPAAAWPPSSPCPPRSPARSSHRRHTPCSHTQGESARTRTIANINVLSDNMAAAATVSTRPASQTLPLLCLLRLRLESVWPPCSYWLSPSSASNTFCLLSDQQLLLFSLTFHFLGFTTVSLGTCDW